MRADETSPPTPVWRRSLAAAGGFGLLALLVWGFLEGRKEAVTERERELPVKAPSRVSMAHDSIIVSLDSAALVRGGVRTRLSQPNSGREQVQAYGTVVGLSALVESRDSHVAAQAKQAQDRARLTVSLAEWKRTEALYADGQSVSAQALQEVEAAYRADQSATDADAALLVTLAGSAREDWGPQIASWIASGSAVLERILDGSEVLIQLTLPPDHRVTSSPAMATIHTADDHTFKVRVISSAGRTDPRIQGPSYFAVAPRMPDLLPGMNLSVTVPGNHNVRGIQVPDSAVVWWQGKAWVYLALSPVGFVRHDLTGATRVGQSYLAADIPPTTLIVVTGAQALLSEELRSQIQVGEEEGKQ
jgi:hypothetical protein